MTATRRLVTILVFRPIHKIHKPPGALAAA
jgi:hypothetical protein